MAEMGRPTKKTDKVVAKLIEAFHDDATIEQACYIADIDKASYYRWIEKDEDFRNEMGKAQEYPKVIAKNTILKAIKSGDAKTAMDFIKRREKDRYSERNEFTGKDGQPLPAPIFSGKSNVSDNDSNEEDI
jgi:hypothetical protein